MIEAAEARAWADGVIRATSTSLRDAYARLCCPFEDGPEGACAACGQWRTEHHAEWVVKFEEGRAGDTHEAMLAGRRIVDALKDHEEMKRFFVATRGSNFVFWCAVLGYDPETLRRGLREVLFFPWSPRVLREAALEVIRQHARERVRRHREKTRSAA